MFRNELSSIYLITLFYFQKVYPIKNIVIDADAMKYFPINNAYFKLRIEGYMNVTKILCVDSAFTLSCKK